METARGDELVIAAAHMRRALDTLRLNWADMYLVDVDAAGRWLATRRDDRTEIKGDSPEELRAAILADFISRPIR